jgi:ABC-type multidrug transport system ATPase subunit
MDPYSRRFAWGFIRAQKPGRTIILTTHFMDGATHTLSGMLVEVPRVAVLTWAHAAARAQRLIC